MASTRELRPEFRPWADLLLDVLNQYGDGYRATSTLRTYADQERLYADWLAGKPGIYTPARPGTSMHELGWAVDIANPDTDPKADDLLHQLGAAWRELGGVWGGDRDPVHFEAPKVWTGRA